MFPQKSPVLRLLLEAISDTLNTGAGAPVSQKSDIQVNQTRLCFVGIEVCRGSKYSTREIHISADIANAILQRYYSGGDLDENMKALYNETLCGIADYWIGRMTYNSTKKLYELLGAVYDNTFL